MNWTRPSWVAALTVWYAAVATASRQSVAVLNKKPSSQGSRIQITRNGLKQIGTTKSRRSMLLVTIQRLHQNVWSGRVRSTTRIVNEIILDIYTYRARSPIDPTQILHPTFSKTLHLSWHLHHNMVTPSQKRYWPRVPGRQPIVAITTSRQQLYGFLLKRKTGRRIGLEEKV